MGKPLKRELYTTYVEYEQKEVKTPKGFSMWRVIELE